MSARLGHGLRTVLGVLQVAAALVLLGLIGALLAGTLPGFAGAESFVVYSGSMAPTIDAGDLTVVAPARPAQLRPADVISYRVAARPEVIVTHRLIGVEQDDDGRLLFETKGDANNAVDQVYVDESAVLGRVLYSVPKIGYLVDFTWRPEGKLLLIVLPALLLAIDGLRTLRRRRQSTVRAAHGHSGEFIMRGRVALQNGAVQAAAALFDRAIAADPYVDDAWLLKAECMPAGPERRACLQAALTVNPTSVRLRQAVERAADLDVAAG